ncbi:MAG: T9SS type A sorting domain-containing protein [Bacteroidales bacterium]|nr:T9SS type A sorting domain-containing protein [Bacteroidales bacterium]
MNLEEKSEVKFEIYNVNGKMLYQTEKGIINSGSSIKEFSTKRTGMDQHGVYFLKVTFNNIYSETIKMVK